MTIKLTHPQIADDLAARIEAGEYGGPGAKLPSYNALAELYEVNRATIQRAIGLLRYRGLVVGSPGVGVFVAPDKQRPPIS